MNESTIANLFAWIMFLALVASLAGIALERENRVKWAITGGVSFVFGLAFESYRQYLMARGL